MAEKEMIILKRDVRALLVPSAAPMMLHKDTPVALTQSLGNSFTVNVYGNLARIEGKDADALGKNPMSALDTLPKNATLKEKIWAQLKTVYDPEIPVNIVDLGLVYRCDIDLEDEDLYEVFIQMTLTAPGCGMGPVLVEDARAKILMIPQIKAVEIEMVFDPAWERSMMSDEAKLQLGLL